MPKLIKPKPKKLQYFYAIRMKDGKYATYGKAFTFLNGCPIICRTKKDALGEINRGETIVKVTLKEIK